MRKTHRKHPPSPTKYEKVRGKLVDDNLSDYREVWDWRGSFGYSLSCDKFRREKEMPHEGDIAPYSAKKSSLL